MPARRLDDAEVVEGFTPVSYRKVEDDEDAFSITRAVGDAAREINIGILEPLGLRPWAAKLGIADYEEGDDSPSAGQGALRMIGMAGAATAGILAAPLKAMGSAQYLLREANLAREGVKSGFKASVGAFVKGTAKTAVKNPIKFAMMETTAAASAGAVGAWVYDETKSPTARMVGELVGGLAPGVAAPAAAALAKTSMIARAVRSGIQRIVTKKGDFLGPGGQRAKERLERAVPDPNKMYGSMEHDDVLPGMSVAERSEEPGLLSLERDILDSTDELTAAGQQHYADINSIMRGAIEDLEPSTASSLEARIYLDNLMETRIQVASTAVDEALIKAGPKVTQEQASRLARTELDKAYTAAKEQENVLWSAVPGEGPAPPTQTLKTMEERLRVIAADRVKSSRGDMPRVARVMLGELKEGGFIPGTLSQGATLEELKTLRSTLLVEATKERARDAPNRRKLGEIAALQDSLLQDMQAADPTNEALDMARAFSADLNARFRQGEVGDILGFSTTGEGSIPAALTLGTTIGRSGLRAAESSDQLLHAVDRSGDKAAMKSHVEDFLSGEFMRAVRKDYSGDFNVKAAAAWMKRRQDVVDRFPELKARLAEAIKAGDTLLVAQGLRNPQTSPAAIILKAPLGEEISRLVRLPKPGTAARDMMGMLAEDTTGDAVKSMRVGLADWILQKASSPTVDVQHTQILSGRLLAKTLNDPGVAEVARQILTAEQRARLQTVLNTAQRMDAARTAAPSLEGVIGDTEGLVLETGRRILAAGLFRNIAKKLHMGGIIQIPAMGVSFSNTLQSRGLDPARMILLDAIMSTDDKLLKSLLENPALGSKKAAENAQRLNAWMFATAAEYGISLTE